MGLTGAQTNASLRLSTGALGQAQTAALLMPSESDLERYGRVVTDRLSGELGCLAMHLARTLGGHGAEPKNQIHH